MTTREAITKEERQSRINLLLAKILAEPGPKYREATIQEIADRYRRLK